MKTLMKIGDYLYLDALDISLCEDDECCDHSHDDHDESGEDSCEHSETFHIESCVERQYSAYGFNWPYFSYGTKNCKVFVYNAFNPSFIQRYELP